MNRKFRYIKLILVFLLGFTLISHAVIPHDHHYDNSDIENHHNDNNSEKESNHCHYFNNIDFDKVRNNNFTKVIKELPIIFTIVFSDFFNVNLSHQINNFINANNNLSDYSSLLSISPTRGSPIK